MHSVFRKKGLIVVSSVPILILKRI